MAKGILARVIELTSEAGLAEAWGFPTERVAELRRSNGWPHVKFGRSDVRYTPEQIALIVDLHTVEADSDFVRSARTGLTPRSAALR